MTGGGEDIRQGKPSGAGASSGGPTRRGVLLAGSAVALGAGAAWRLGRLLGKRRAEVFIGRVADYSGRIEEEIRKGMAALGVEAGAFRNKSVVLKPNLVETDPAQAHINTHPAVVVATANVVRGLGARSVVVAEGQGHRRDSEIVLDESGMGEALDRAELPFVDLNHDDVGPIRNAGRFAKVERWYLPKTILEADVVVSLAKLKTHHWAGMTAAMKNLFGVMPGCVYGWPKNVLHQHGIHHCVLDINSTVRTRFSIVDGIVGMEGDGPVMGRPKHAGCLIMGTNPAAVDVTCARVMRLAPEGIGYLAASRLVFGPLGEADVVQRGAAIESVRRAFELIDAPHLSNVRAV